VLTLVRRSVAPGAAGNIMCAGLCWSSSPLGVGRVSQNRRYLDTLVLLLREKSPLRTGPSGRVESRGERRVEEGTHEELMKSLGIY
jgi:hypothetical protein